MGLDLLDYHDNFLKGIGIGIVLVVYLAYFFLFLFHLGQQGFGGDGLLGFDVGESGDILVLGGNEDVGVLGVGNHHGGDGDALGEGIHFALGELDEIVGKDLLLVDEDGDGLVVGSNYLAVVEDSPLGWGGLLDGIGVGDLDGGRCVGCYFFWAWQEPENQCLLAGIVVVSVLHLFHGLHFLLWKNSWLQHLLWGQQNTHLQKNYCQRENLIGVHLLLLGSRLGDPCFDRK